MEEVRRSVATLRTGDRSKSGSAISSSRAASAWVQHGEAWRE